VLSNASFLPPSGPRIQFPPMQVEHTVTEEVTGIDIVQSQIKIAGGATLESIGLGSQEAVGQPLGYALQCRITCEDPATNFQPDTGRIQVTFKACKVSQVMQCGLDCSSDIMLCPLQTVEKSSCLTSTPSSLSDQAYRSPGGPGIRLDGALGAGNTVSRYYDSLLVKVTAD